MPVTVPIILYLTLLFFWACRPLSQIKLDLRRKSVFEQLGIYGTLCYLVLGLLGVCIGLLRGPNFFHLFSHTAPLVGFVPALFLVREHVRDVRALRFMARMIVVSLVLVCLYGISQRIFGQARVMVPGVTISYADAFSPDPFALKSNLTAVGLKVMSTFQNGNLFGNFLVLSVPLAIALATISRGWSRLMYLIVSVLALANLMLTLSRGAIVAGMLSTLVVAWLLRPAKVPLCVAACFVAIGGALLYGLQLGERLLTFDLTAGGRVPMWTELARKYSELSPGSFAFTFIAGSGMGAAVGTPSEPVVGTEGSLLMILLKMGVLGLLAFLTGVYGIARFAGWEHSPSLTPESAIARGLAAGLIGAAIQFGVDSVMLLPPTAMNFWIVGGLALTAGSIARRRTARA